MEARPHSRESVSQWLLEAPKSDVAWVLAVIYGKRPGIVLDTVQNALPNDTQTQQINSKVEATLNSEPRWSGRLKLPSDGDNGQGVIESTTVVQFSCADYFCAEGESHIEIQVMRIGQNED